MNTPFFEILDTQYRCLRGIRGLVADAADRARAAKVAILYCVQAVPEAVIVQLSHAEAAEQTIVDEMGLIEQHLTLGQAMLRHYGLRLIDVVSAPRVDDEDVERAKEDFHRLAAMAGAPRWRQTFQDVDTTALTYLAWVVADQMDASADTKTGMSDALLALRTEHGAA